MMKAKFEYSSSMYRDGNTIGRDKFLEKYGEDKEELYDHIKELDYIIWRVRNTITKLEENSMGKVKDWLMEMEEDATIMSRKSWLEMHGKNKEYIFDRIQAELDEVQGELELHTQK